MHRIDTFGHASNLFTDGNPGTGTPATVVDDDWLNAIQEEIVNVILTRAGLPLVKGTNTELGTALDIMFGGVNPGGRINTQANPTQHANASSTTIYYSAYLHDRIRLYDGTRWKWYQFSQMSQATTDATKSPAATSADNNYDIFVWDDGGTLRATRGPAWSSATARGTGAGTTELESFDGRYVNKIAITNGPAARRGLYVGTIRTGSGNNVTDSNVNRHVWNMYNRLLRYSSFSEASATWTYTTDTWREVNANAGGAARVNLVRGFDEDAVRAEVNHTARNTSTGVQIQTAVGVANSATAPTTPAGLWGIGHTQVANLNQILQGSYLGAPGLGVVTINHLERSAATGTTTWVGQTSGLNVQVLC
jgi:hypothetical protein